MGSSGGQGGSQTTSTQQLDPNTQRMNELRVMTANTVQDASGGPSTFARTPSYLYGPSSQEGQYLNTMADRTWLPLTNTMEGQALAGMDQALGAARQGLQTQDTQATQRAGQLQQQMWDASQATAPFLAGLGPGIQNAYNVGQQGLGQAQQNIAGLTQGVQNQIGQYDPNQGYQQALGGYGQGQQLLQDMALQGQGWNTYGMQQQQMGNQMLGAQQGGALQGAQQQMDYITAQQMNALYGGQLGGQQIANTMAGLQQMGGQWGAGIGAGALGAAGPNYLDALAQQYMGQGMQAPQGWLNDALAGYAGYGTAMGDWIGAEARGGLAQNAPETQAWQYLNQAGGPGRTNDILASLGGLQQGIGQYGTDIAQRANQATQWGALDTAGNENLYQAMNGGLTPGILGQMSAQAGGFQQWGSDLGQAAMGAAGMNAADLAGGNYLGQATGAGYTPQIFEQLRQQQERIARAENESTGIGAGLQQGMGQNPFEGVGLGGLQQAGQAGYTPEILAQIAQQRQQQLQQQAGITQGIQGGMTQNPFEGLGMGGLQQALQQGMTPDILARIQQQQQLTQQQGAGIRQGLQQGMGQNLYEQAGMGGLTEAMQAGMTPEIRAMIAQQQAQAQQQGAGITQGLQQGMQQNQFEGLGFQGLQGAMGAGMTPQIQQALTALSQRGDAGSIAIRDRLLQSLGPNAMEAMGNQAFQGAGGDLGAAGINQNLAQQLQQGAQAGQQIGQQVTAGQALTPQEQAARAQLEQSYADQGMTGINQQLGQMNAQSAQQAQQIRDRLTQNMGLTGFEQWGQQQFNRATDPTSQLAGAQQYLEQVVGGELANRLQQGGLGGVRSGAYGEDLARAGADLILPILQQTQQLQGQAGAAGLQAGAGLRQAGIQTGGVEQGLLGQLQQGGLGAAQVGAGMLGDVRAAQTAAGQAGLQAEAQRRAAGLQGAGIQGDILGQLLQTGVAGGQIGAGLSNAQRQALTQQGQAQLQAGGAQRAAGMQAGGIEAGMLQALQQAGLGGQQLLGQMDMAQLQRQLGVGQAGLGAGEAYRQAGIQGAGVQANLLGQLMQQGQAGAGTLADLERQRQQTALGVGQAGLGAGEAYRQAGIQGAGIERDLLGQLVQQGTAGTAAMTDLERQRQQTALGVGQAGMQAGEAYRQAGLTGAQIQAGMMGQVGQLGAQGTSTAADLERARQATQLGIGQAGLQAGQALRTAGVQGAGVQADLLQALLQGSGQGANTLLDLERARQATALGAGQAQLQQAQGLRQAGLTATGQQGDILSQLIQQGTAQTGQMGDLERARQATALGAGQAQFQQAQGMRQAGLGAAGIEADLLAQLQQGGLQSQQLAAQMDQAQRAAQLGIGQAGLGAGEALRRAGIDTGQLNAGMMQNLMQYGLGSTQLSADMQNQQRQAQMGGAELAAQMAQNQRAGGLQAAGIQTDLLNQLLGTGMQGQGIQAGLVGQQLQAGMGATGQQSDMMRALLGGGLQGAGQQADFTQGMTNMMLNQGQQGLGQQAGLMGQIMGTGADIYGTRAGAGSAGLNALANIYGTGVGAQTALSGQNLQSQADWQRALTEYTGMGVQNQQNFMNQLGLQQGRYLDYGLGQGQQQLGLMDEWNQANAARLGYGTGLEGRETDRLAAALQATGVPRESAYDAWSRDADYVASIMTGLPVMSSTRTKTNTELQKDWYDFALNAVGTVAGAAGAVMTT